MCWPETQRAEVLNAPKATQAPCLKVTLYAVSLIWRSAQSFLNKKQEGTGVEAQEATVLLKHCIHVFLASFTGTWWPNTHQTSHASSTALGAEEFNKNSSPFPSSRLDRSATKASPVQGQQHLGCWVEIQIRGSHTSLLLCYLGMGSWECAFKLPPKTPL